MYYYANGRHMVKGMSRFDQCILLACLVAIAVVAAIFAVHHKNSSPAPAPGPPAPGPPAPGPPASVPAGSGDVICNQINLHQGVATITEYKFGSPGTFGVNSQVPHNYYGAAVPYAWYSTTTSVNGLAAGNCENGITGQTGSLPTHSGKTLCYTLTQPGKTSALNIIVTETCGGNCQPGDEDCTLHGADQYKPANRDYPHQLCPRPPTNFPNGNMWHQITGSKAPNVAYGTSKSTCDDAATHKDWCSGYYAHFDIDIKAGWGNGIVNYTRTLCPTS